MVDNKAPLGRTFTVLVDSTRRPILSQLERNEYGFVLELAEPVAIGLRAVMKHLTVLVETWLVTRAKCRRRVTLRPEPQSMREAMEWLRSYERFWAGNLDPVTMLSAGRPKRGRSIDGEF